MNLSFLIYSYFPYGGQQRDFMRILLQCIKNGHKITVYTLKWQGDKPAGVEIIIVPVSALSRHKLYQRYTTWVTAEVQKNSTDGIIGFNKMPGLTVYFAADPCFAEKANSERGVYYKFTPRYKHFSSYEEAVFGHNSDTKVLYLSPRQKIQFTRHYPGCESRLHEVPPGISLDRKVPPDAAEIRKRFRQQLQLTEQCNLIVQIGSGFVVKGVDRSLRAIASLPQGIRENTLFIVIGQDKPARFKSLAKKLGIKDNCRFLSGRDDIPMFLLGADLLLHPAYSESAGYVLLEATISGLPVLTTESCGYSFHIEKANSGEVVPMPFQQNELNNTLEIMLQSPQRPLWRRNGLAYGLNAELFSLPTVAANLISQFVEASSRNNKRNKSDAIPVR